MADDGGEDLGRDLMGRSVPGEVMRKHEHHGHRRLTDSGVDSQKI
jgi:hypothetical protein